MKRLLVICHLLLVIGLAASAQSNLTYELKIGTTGENTLLAEFPESYSGEKVNIGIQTVSLTEYRVQTELLDFVFTNHQSPIIRFDL